AHRRDRPLVHRPRVPQRRGDLPAVVGAGALHDRQPLRLPDGLHPGEHGRRRPSRGQPVQSVARGASGATGIPRLPASPAAAGAAVRPSRNAHPAADRGLSARGRLDLWGPCMGSGLQHRRPADPAADEPAAGPLRAPLRRPSGLKRLWRRMRLSLHLLSGLAIAIGRFPFAGLETRRALRRNWSHKLLDILGIELRITGADIAPGTLVVANHVSWLDIFVINAVAPAGFISKAEVRRWPAIGWLAAKNETVFLQRGSRG